MHYSAHRALWKDRRVLPHRQRGVVVVVVGDLRNILAFLRGQVTCLSSSKPQTQLRSKLSVWSSYPFLYVSKAAGSRPDRRPAESWLCLHAGVRPESTRLLKSHLVATCMSRCNP